MIIDRQSIDLAFKGFKTLYTDAYTDAPANWDKVSMVVPSGSAEETYGWLGQFPQLREWLGGSRIVKDLAAHSFTIANRKFESTVGVERDDFDDDRLGIYSPMFAEMGHLAKQHPDELLFGLLASGFTEFGYDGQPFFDADHPSKDADGAQVTVSNVQDGAGPAWYLLDTSRAVKPLIWQERAKYDFQTVNSLQDNEVFMTDTFKYGVRARVNAGFGLWQMAYASKAALTAENYAAARAAMQAFRGDNGGILGTKPTVMIVSPGQESEALDILSSPLLANGGTNKWSGTAELIVTPYVSA